MWLNFIKAFSRLVGRSFKIILFKKMSSVVVSQNPEENLNFLTSGIPFK